MLRERRRIETDRVVGSRKKAVVFPACRGKSCAIVFQRNTYI